MKHLFVWMRWSTGALSLTGELAVTEPDRSNGRFESECAAGRLWRMFRRIFAGA